MGPTLIFDKSTLQSLNPDEAVWLDQFFTTNITPLFFVESLADLEKEMRAGRTAEQLVGSLAYKTPDFSSKPNVHHNTLIEAELLGGVRVPMSRRPVVGSTEVVRLGAETGVILKRTPEEEALARWMRHDFIELERQTAKHWRQALERLDLEGTYQMLQRMFEHVDKPASLVEAKDFSASFLDNLEQEQLLVFGMQLLNVTDAGQANVARRWTAAGNPAIQHFAPYFRFVIGVNLFFFIAMAADLIARTRPSNVADLAYLYYLPFCMVFTSGDKLQARIVPLFLDEDQSFVEGTALKEDLRKLDQHYSTLPDEIKSSGILAFAGRPPLEQDFLISRLWDKHLPGWRGQSAEIASSDKVSAEVFERVRRIREARSIATPQEAVTSDDIDSMLIERQVWQKKGKWRRFNLPPE